MALKTFVKVGSINNLSDARYCAGMEVDLIGFGLEKESPGYIAPDTFKELTDWLSGVAYVGEFENASQKEIEETLNSYSIDYVQVNDINHIDNLVKIKPVILNWPIEELNDLPKGLPLTYLQISGGNSDLLKEELDEIRAFSDTYDILLGTGINEKNIGFVQAQCGAKGIALQGGDELRPGYKDYDELADILEALEINDLT